MGQGFENELLVERSIQGDAITSTIWGTFRLNIIGLKECISTVYIFLFNRFTLAVLGTVYTRTIVREDDKIFDQKCLACTQ